MDSYVVTLEHPAWDSEKVITFGNSYRNPIDILKELHENWWPIDRCSKIEIKKITGRSG